MWRALLLLLTLASFAAMVYFHSEMRRWKGRAERQTTQAERANRAMSTAQAASSAREAALAKSAADLAAASATVRRLEGELRAEMGRRDAVDELIEKTGAAFKAERERYNAKLRAAKKYMPEGVRQALLTINECLRADGQYGLRLMRAEKIEDFKMYGVQIFDNDPGTLEQRLFLAGEVTFEVDRAKGTLTWCFKDGFHRSRAGRREFPPAGERLVLQGVDGRSWEAKLPFLVRGVGEYPAPAAQKPKLESMARLQRATWRRRVNTVLATAQTKTRFQLNSFRTLRAGHFRDVLLLGYDSGKKLAMSIEAEHLWMHVDAAEGTVALVMTDGLLRRAGGETPLPKTGYRIRLRGVKPAKAVDVMMGMVSRK